MRKIGRAPKAGRVAVVVPNGMLFGDGVAARIQGEEPARRASLLPPEMRSVLVQCRLSSRRWKEDSGERTRPRVSAKATRLRAGLAKSRQGRKSSSWRVAMTSRRVARATQSAALNGDERFAVALRAGWGDFGGHGTVSV